MQNHAMPKNAVKIDEPAIDIKNFQHFENRDVLYNAKLLKEYDSENNKDNSLFISSNEFFNLKIFWLDKNNNLGFGIADDWKTNSIQWYKIGDENVWSAFKNRIKNAQY